MFLLAVQHKTVETRQETRDVRSVHKLRQEKIMNSINTNHSGCEADLLYGKRLQQPSPSAVAALIFIIIIHIFTFPFTAVLNALVMIAVKTKPRLRAHKSNILLALLASTDFMVGVLIQPSFTAVLVMFLLDEPIGYCVMRVLRAVLVCLVGTSLFHLVLISGERYLAMKHPFAYTTIVTEVCLLVASVLAWVLSVILQIPLAVDKIVYLLIYNIFAGLSIAFIVFCHVTVYRETRRHEQQLAAQQVTQEAREQFQRDKKALKLTSIILAVVILCYVPTAVFSVVTVRYREKVSLETVYIFSSFASSIMLLNSLFNPIIYSVRMRQFRVAFIELTCRTMNISEAEETEMRVFGTPNAVAALQEGQEQGGLDPEQQRNVNNSGNQCAATAGE